MCLVVKFWSPTNVSEQSTEARTAPDAKRLQLQRFQRIFPCTTVCFWFQQQNDHVTWLTGACLISWRAHFNRALLKIRLVSPWYSFLVPIYVRRKSNTSSSSTLGGSTCLLSRLLQCSFRLTYMVDQYADLCWLFYCQSQIRKDRTHDTII